MIVAETATMMHQTQDILNVGIKSNLVCILCDPHNTLHITQHASRHATQHTPHCAQRTRHGATQSNKLLHTYHVRTASPTLGDSTHRTRRSSLDVVCSMSGTYNLAKFDNRQQDGPQLGTGERTHELLDD